MKLKNQNGSTPVIYMVFTFVIVSHYLILVTP